MAESRRTKKTALIEDFAEKIRNGLLPAGSIFPNTEELARRYKISIGTASKVIYELGQLNLLEISRGRRTKVCQILPKSNYPQLGKPVGILSPNMNFGQHSRWREWILHYTQRSLLEHGNQALWLPDTFDLMERLHNFSGFIVTGEMISDDCWQQLLASGLPCSRISFARPYANSVYVDYRPALDKIVLHLFAKQCRRILFLFSNSSEVETAYRWFGEMGFLALCEHYGISETQISKVVLSAESEDGRTDFSNEVLASREKLAIITVNAIFSQPINDIMGGLGFQAGTDYEAISLSHIPHEITVNDYADLKCELIVEKLLELFYRQVTSPASQVAEIIYPELVTAPQN